MSKFELFMLLLALLSAAVTVLSGVRARQQMAKGDKLPSTIVYGAVALLGVPFTVFYAVFVGWLGIFLVSLIATVLFGVFAVKSIMKGKVISAVVYGFFTLVGILSTVIYGWLAL